MESLKSVLPIALIVFALSVTLVPTEPGNMLLFLIGVVFLVFGMSLFTAGAEMSMQPLGSKVGSTIAGSGKIWLIVPLSLIITLIFSLGIFDKAVQFLLNVPKRKTAEISS